MYRTFLQVSLGSPSRQLQGGQALASASERAICRKGMLKGKHDAPTFAKLVSSEPNWPDRSSTPRLPLPLVGVPASR